MELITLNHTEYKEKDAIVNAISEDGEYTFLARGLLDPKSKNIILSSPLVIADIETMDGNYKHPILKASKLLMSPYGMNDSLEKLASISLVEEASRVLLQEEEKSLLFPELKKAVMVFKDNSVNPLTVALIYLANVLKNVGYEFEVNKCVYCGSKQNIAAFSFSDGGFICKDCMDEYTPSDLTPSQMRVVRAIFLLKEYKDIPDTSDHDLLVVLHGLIDFIKDGLGITLKSYSLLNFQ